MTDPFSLTVGVVSLFKETYLVASYIYKTINSAKSHDAEHKQLVSAVRIELLFLRSFGKYITRANGIVVGDLELDELWLESIFQCFEDLRQDFVDYARLAGDDDPDYRAFSPWLNTSMSTKRIEFDLNRAVPPVTEASFFSKIWSDKKTKIAHFGLATKWALFDRRRLERVLGNFQAKNLKLREILQFASAAWVQHQVQQSENMRMLRQNEAARTLGLVEHAEIRQLITDASTSQVDLELAHAELDVASENDTIGMGTLKTTVAAGNVTTERVLVEYKTYTAQLPQHEPTIQSVLRTGEESASDSEGEPPGTEQRVKQLASLLHTSASESRNTLPLKGFLRQPQHSRYAFVYHFPPQVVQEAPLSLHHIIGSSQLRWNLACRFHIAEKLARSVAVLHADGWVHKSISSHATIFFRKGESLDTRTPYLAGFEYSRPETGSTMLLHDTDEERNLYQHPDIQDVARSSFSKIHDLYALGVVLLEIAVWQTAAAMRDTARVRLPPDQSLNAKGVQKVLVSVAKKKVPHLMGDAYLEAVLACLESKYASQAYRRDFSKIFLDEIVENLSFMRLGG